MTTGEQEKEALFSVWSDKEHGGVTIGAGPTLWTGRGQERGKCILFWHAEVQEREGSPGEGAVMCHFITGIRSEKWATR